MARSRVRQVIAGLDVGTTKICCVIADWSPVGNLDIVGVGTSPSRGLRKGVVVNIDSTVESIKHAVAEAEEMAGVEIPSVIAGVAGGHIRGINSRGVVAVSGKHREVSQADIDRALDAARAVNLPQDREIIHVLPQTFLVDDQDGVKEPLGMSGVRLEVEVHLVTGATTSVRNVVRSVNRAGLQVQDLVLEPLASAEAVISTEEKELGILLIDLGGGTTDVALFRDGAVWHTSSLPLGGDHISNDIAVGLRTPTADAEELKKRDMDYMDVSTGGLDPRQKIPLAPGYQAPFAEKVKKESGITTMTVGLIAGYQQAEDIVASGKADMICLARGAMWDPRWAWHAAEELGAEAPYAPKTMACHPKLRPQLFPKRAQPAG